MKAAFWHAVPITACIGGLFYYWFAVANRCVIFLYAHLGATPFDPNTSSRYWMAGLVAAGAGLILYTAANWLGGRLIPQYVPPKWWHVWLLSAPALAILIPVITTTFNQPVLPLELAAACTAAALLGLALALYPGALAAQRPCELGWQLAAGLGLVPTLLLLRVVELPERGLVSKTIAYGFALGGTLAGSAWLVLVAWLYARRYKTHWQTRQLLAMGLGKSYLLLPLAHHLLFTPPEYRYITNAANFFALNPFVQLASFAVTVLLGLGVTRWQRELNINQEERYGTGKI